MARSVVAAVFADEWTPLVATLVRELGDLWMAEDAAQDAFVEATRRWGAGTTPERPGAWLLTTARRKALDRLRRDRRYEERLPALHRAATVEPVPAKLGDDQLALIFGCCHTALGVEARVALTLREVCGLSTAQIARAFIVPEATMAKRLVRAKTKVRAAGVPFNVPDAARHDARLGAVLHVVYLIFTEGHSSSEAAALVRGDLCDEARWLAHLLGELLPEESEVLGLGALLALTDARRAARVADDGTLVLLEDQDRSRWDAALIADGLALLARAWSTGSVGPYQLQATIAAVHARAPSAEATDWREIARLYNALAVVAPGPVVELNRAVAVAMAEGPGRGLELVDAIAEGGELDGYRYLHGARADLLRRLGRTGEARQAYRRCLALSSNETERRFLQARLVELAERGGADA